MLDATVAVLLVVFGMPAAIAFGFVVAICATSLLSFFVEPGPAEDDRGA